MIYARMLNKANQDSDHISIGLRITYNTSQLMKKYKPKWSETVSSSKTWKGS